jgi:hypothetical protein
MKTVLQESFGPTWLLMSDNSPLRISIYVTTLWMRKSALSLAAQHEVGSTENSMPCFFPPQHQSQIFYFISHNIKSLRTGDLSIWFSLDFQNLLHDA